MYSIFNIFNIQQKAFLYKVDTSAATEQSVPWNKVRAIPVKGYKFAGSNFSGSSVPKSSAGITNQNKN